MPKVMTRQAAKTIAVVVPLVRSKLAMDHKSVDLRKVFEGVSAATFTEDKPRILRNIQRVTKGKLAQDASIGEVAELLDLIDSHGIEEDESVSKAQHNAMEAAAHGTSNLGIPKKVGKEFAEKDKGKTFDAEEKQMPKEDGGGLHGNIHEFLKDKISGEDMDKVHGMLAKRGGAQDEDDHEEDEEADREEEKFGGGEDEEGGEEKLEDLGAATGEDEEYDLKDKESGSESKQEQRDNAEEWRRGEKKDRPATDKKHAKDKKRAKDEPPSFKGRPQPGGGMDRRGSAHDKAITKSGMEAALDVATRQLHAQDQSMNAAIEKATKAARAHERGIRDAERAVAPYVGRLEMSFDSGDDVYAHALRLLNVDTRGCPPSAYPHLLKLVRRPGEPPKANKTEVAMDAKTVDSFNKFYPGATRIGTV